MPNEMTTLPQLTPPNPFEEMSGIYAGRQPRREFELAKIQRKIEEAGLQQKASQEKRAQQDQRLKQLSAYATIAKVVHSMGDAIPPEAKSNIAQKFTDEAVADNMPITDKSFFDALMNQPNELSKFLDSYSQSKQIGDDDLTALTKGNQNITDPEVQKLVSETFQKLVVEGVKGINKQGKAINPNDVDALIASGGKIVGETIPLGFTLPMAQEFQKQQREKRQILVPEAFGQQLGLARGKAEAQSAVAAETGLADLNSVDTLVGAISSLANELITAENPLELTKQAALLKAGSLSRTNPTANAYEAQSAAFVGTLARALGGERGVLTDRDIIRVGRALPGFTDTKQIKDYKLGNLKLLVDAAKEGKKARVENRPVKSSTDRIQQLLLGLEKVKTTPPPPPGTIPLRH